MTYSPVTPIPAGSIVYTQGSGTNTIAPVVVFGTAPSSSVIHFALGQIVIVPSTNSIYQLTSFTSSNGNLSANWTLIASNGGNIVAIDGTANQISVSTTNGIATISLPSSITTPGSLTTTTSLASGTTTTVGTKLLLTASSGAASITGTTAAMTAGVITTDTTAVTSSSIILYSVVTPGGTVGTYTLTKTAGTSFTITSTSSAETSTFNYLIIN